MDESSYTSLLALVALIALHAIIILTASALKHSRQSALRERQESGDRRAKRALTLIDKPAQVSITRHFTLTLVKFLIAAVTVLGLAPLYSSLDANSSVEFSPVVALILLAVAGYVVGELLPYAFGRAYADQVALTLAPLMQVLVFLFAPIVFLFQKLDSAVAKLTGGDDLSKAVIEEEIIDLVESSEREGALEDEERDMIRSVLEFDETMVREIMVPRVDITAVELNDPLREALRQFIESGHSRIPVYEDEIDDIKGLLYAKDLLAAWYSGEFEQKTIGELMRPAHFVPETKRAEDLFREFQRSNTQLAIVVDEFGSTAGVISVEDIVEEIVGDIRDEYDITETVEYVELGPDKYSVDAGINLYDFNQLFDTNLPTEENDSLGGYLYQEFGRVPEVGAQLETGDLTLIIESVEGVRIRQVHVLRKQPEKPEKGKPPEKEQPPESTEPLSPRIEPHSNEA